MTGTATRNAASTTVRGPKSGLMCRRLRLRLGRLRALRLCAGSRSLGCAREGSRGRERAWFARLLGGTNDRRGDLRDRLGPHARSREQLLGALLTAGDDDPRLAARPLERLLDLCAG